MKTNNQRYPLTMRSFLPLLAASVVIAACGGPSGDTELASLIAQRDSIKEARKALNEELTSIEEQIEKLDTNKILRITNVTTLELQPERFEHFFTVQGAIETDQNALIYPEAAGRVTAIWVKEGTKVNKGKWLHSAV